MGGLAMTDATIQRLGDALVEVADELQRKYGYSSPMALADRLDDLVFAATFRAAEAAFEAEEQREREREEKEAAKRRRARRKADHHGDHAPKAARKSNAGK